MWLRSLNFILACTLLLAASVRGAEDGASSQMPQPQAAGSGDAGSASTPDSGQTGGPEPGWLGVIRARGDLQQAIESTPILERPYRPLHFYGNAVRRSYYRGSPLPLPRDFVQGTAAFFSAR